MKRKRKRRANDPKPTRELVLVEWLDSHGSSGWERLDTLTVRASGVSECHSVGWVLSREHDALTLVSHVSDETAKQLSSQAYGYMTIPNCAIVRVTKIRSRR